MCEQRGWEREGNKAFEDCRSLNPSQRSASSRFSSASGYSVKVCVLCSVGSEVIHALPFLPQGSVWECSWQWWSLLAVSLVGKVMTQNPSCLWSFLGLLE